MNNKSGKIFDIIPPNNNEINKGELSLREIPEEKRSRVKWRFFLFFGFLIVLGVAGYIFLAQVEIIIWPKTQAITVEEKAEFDTKITLIDFLAGRLPTTILEVSQELTKNFPATGRISREEKAQGKIKVYNAYSDVPQVLVNNTRFLSAEGKLFYSTERVTIPGGTYEKGKLIPGSLDITVVAAEAGADYNIGPSTFSIPGFSGSPKYTAFYGKSFSAMTGGFKGEIPKVTREDLERAKNALIAELSEKENNALQERASRELILVGGAVKQEVKEDFCSVQEGAEVSSFDFRTRMIMKALVVKKSDLENFAKELILSRMLKEKEGNETFWSKREIQDESLKIDLKLESVDLESGKAVLTLAISGNAYYGFNESSLKRAVSGRSLEETKDFLESQPQIEKAEVKAWPFWIGGMPQQENKVKIEMRIE